MRHFKFICILFSCSSFSIYGQPDTSSLYDQYPDIFIGTYLSADMDGLMFSYSYFDSLENNYLEAGHESRYLKTSLQVGATISTKYFGFSYAIPGMRDIFTSQGATLTSSKYKSFSVPFYFKSMYFKAAYTSIQGMETGDTTFSSVKTKRYSVQSTYYFNRKAPMGKLLSFLGMPTQSLFSWGLKCMGVYSTITNNGYSFLRTGIDQDYNDLWNYAHSYNYGTIAFAPGVSKIMVNKKYKNEKERRLRLFLGFDLYLGPTFYWNNMDCVDPRNNAEKTGVGFYGILNTRWGISTRRLLLESRGFLSFYTVKNNRMSTTNVSESILFTLGYRIGFEKGYQKIDGFKSRIVREKTD